MDEEFSGASYIKWIEGDISKIVNTITRYKTTMEIYLSVLEVNWSEFLKLLESKTEYQKIVAVIKRPTNKFVEKASNIYENSKSMQMTLWLHSRTIQTCDQMYGAFRKKILIGIEVIVNNYKKTIPITKDRFPEGWDFLFSKSS